MEPFNSRDKGENGLPDGLLGGLQLELSIGFEPDIELVSNWRGNGDFWTSAEGWLFPVSGFIIWFNLGSESGERIVYSLASFFLTVGGVGVHWIGNSSLKGKVRKDKDFY